MTAAEIAKQMEGRLFATVPEVAEILGYDERTIRRGIRSGQIPATQVGATHRVPTAWILAQALIGSAACPAAPLDNASTTADQLDAELVKRLTLPPWEEVETELVEIYSSEISTYDGVKAVYGRIQDMLVHELIAARAAMAGDA